MRSEHNVNLYEILSGEDLRIGERIQQLRLMMLVHSCIYYEMNQNIISDKKWDECARELRKLQGEYPDISKQVGWYEAFADWDASSGAFLPLKDEWVVAKAKMILTPTTTTSKTIRKSKKEMNRTTYRVACEYMAETELFDRTLPHREGLYDTTESFVFPSYQGCSYRFAMMLRTQLTKRFGVKWADVQSAIKAHPSYTAEKWINEWESLKKTEKDDE